MKVADKQCPVTSALQLTIESNQLDVEERFYRSMKRVAIASKYAATCTHSEKCIDGEIDVYSARIDAPIKQEFIESVQQLYRVKAKAERNNFQEARDLAPIDGPTKGKRLSRHAPQPLSRETSFWTQVTDTFEDDRDHPVTVSTKRTITFDDDDDILEGRRMPQSDEQESNSFFSLVGEISNTFDDGDLPASSTTLPDISNCACTGFCELAGDFYQTFDD